MPIKLKYWNYKFLTPRQLVPLLIVVFLFSGFSGLIYQSIWTHYIKLILGHSAYAQALVLATFMAGLALGSWWAARLSHGKRQLLILYALAEAVVGLYALCFHSAFVGLNDYVIAVLPPNLASPAAAVWLNWLMSVLLILPPAILLGTTFPLMAGSLLRRAPEQTGRLLGLLYFSNSFGAGLGVLASGFLMIRWLGLEHTVMTAGYINLAVALVALLVVVSSAEQEQPLTASLETPRVAGSNQDMRRLMLGVALLTGLASFIYELSWIRMLTMVLGSATHSFELMLASFIFGLAFGGLLIRRHLDRVANHLKLLAWIQLLMGLAAAATVIFYNQLFELMAWMMGGLAETESGYLLYKLGSFGLAMMVMLPATILAGMTLPLITASLIRSGHNERAVGQVYSVNTLGAIIGVALTASLLIPALGLRNALLIGASIDVLLAVCLVAVGAARLPRRWPVAFALIGMVGIGGITQFVHFDPARMASGVFRTGVFEIKNSEVLFQRDGRTASVTVSSSKKGRISIETNGKTDAAINPLGAEASRDELTMIMVGLLGSALKPSAEEVAVIGFGSGLTTHTLLGVPGIKRVDTIEIEAAMVEGARYFGDRVERAYSDPRSRIHIDDARNFFSNRGLSYDLIVSEPPNPWVSGVSSLFTLEHYQRISRHLKPGGVYLQWLQLYEFDVQLVVSVLKAFSQVFDDYVLYAVNEGNLIIAGVVDGRLGGLSGEVFKSDVLSQELERIDIKEVADISARMVASKKLVQAYITASSTPPNSDYFPFLDQHAELARYTRSNASDFGRLHRIWLLLNTEQQKRVLNNHTYSRKNTLTRRALEARFLRTLFKDNLDLSRYGDARIPVVPYEKAISVSRLLYRCNPTMVEMSWLEDAAWISDITTIYGAPGLISPFWSALMASDCFEQLPAQIQSAFRFFLAASDRNNKDILREGRIILRYNFDVPGFRDYRILHMLAAYQRANKLQAAARFIARLGDLNKLKFEVRVLAMYLLEQARQVNAPISVNSRAAPSAK